MSNRNPYNTLANDIGEMNEQNEAYVAISGEAGSGSSLPENLSTSGPNNRAPVDNSANNQASGQSGSQSTTEGNGNSRERTERIDGHDEIFVHSGSADYECPVCMLVLRDPVQTPCGHRLCAACIHRHIRYLEQNIIRLFTAVHNRPFKCYATHIVCGC